MMPAAAQVAAISMEPRAPLDSTFEDLLRPHARRGPDPADDDQGDDAVHRGAVGGVHQHHQADEQDHDRHEQVALFHHDLAEDGQLLLLQPLQADRGGVEVDHEVGRAEIEKGRDHGRERHLGVGDAQDLGHQEGARPHDRRDDLAAGGVHGLDGAGHRPAEAGGLHQRDVEHPVDDHVGHRGAGGRADQGARDDGDLGRPAAGPAGDAAREVDEEAPGAGGVHEGPEEHEEEDVVGRGQDRQAEDAVQAEHVGDHAVPVVALVVEEPRHVVAEVAVEDEQGGEDRERPAGGPPRHLPDRDDEHGGHDEVPGLGHDADAVDPLVELDEDVGRRHHEHQHQDDVEDGQPVHALALPAGHQGEDQQTGEDHVHRAEIPGVDGADGQHPDVEEAHGQTDEKNRGLAITPPGLYCRPAEISMSLIFICSSFFSTSLMSTSVRYFLRPLSHTLLHRSPLFAVQIKKCG